MVTEARERARRDQTPSERPEPLHDSQAEQAVVGGCLLSLAALDDALEILQPEHFRSEQLATVFRAMRDMRTQGRNAIDAVTVADWINDSGAWSDAGGMKTLLESMETVPTTYHTAEYARIVRDKCRRRRAWETAAVLKERLSDPGMDTDELLADAETQLHAALDDSADSGPAAVGDILVDALNALGTVGPKVRHVQSGLQSLDNHCGGFPIGGVTIVGARPSTGKTSLMMSAALRTAESGTPVLFISYEQPKIEMAERLLSQVSGVAFTAIHRGHTDGATNQRLVQDANTIQRLPMYLDDSMPGQTQLGAMIRRCVRRHKVQLVVIDYLQLIEPANQKAQREQQIASISRSLKKLAMNLNVAVVVASQLNRESEKRESRKPKLADLRESGSIEQDADLVWLLWRPNVGEVERADDHGEIVVAKQRNGPVGDIKLQWNGATMTYRDMPGVDPGDYV